MEVHRRGTCQSFCNSPILVGGWQETALHSGGVNGSHLKGWDPFDQRYRSLVETKGFKSLSAIRRIFISNEEHLRAYMQKWVKDPLHQWSRQWEYPYVYENAKAELQTDQETRVLDAGSGVTFFSYYLNSEFESIQVHACDYDKTLLNTYAQINQQSNQSVEFAHADLRSLPSIMTGLISSTASLFWSTLTSMKRLSRNSLGCFDQVVN